MNLIDGSGLTAPDYRIYNEIGERVVENQGVTSNIIDVYSKKYSKGYDIQLMKAVEEVIKKINTETHVNSMFTNHFPADK